MFVPCVGFKFFFVFLFCHESSILSPLSIFNNCFSYFEKTTIFCNLCSFVETNKTCATSGGEQVLLLIPSKHVKNVHKKLYYRK